MPERTISNAGSKAQNSSSQPGSRPSLGSLTALERTRILNEISDEEAAILLYDWLFWAREKQLPPAPPWRIWLILAGRGFGKTRTGAEWVRAGAESGELRRIAVIGATAGDVRDVMIEGESGLLAIAPPWRRPHYEPSKRRLTWPSGSIATLLSADDPDQVRGHQFDAAWADEIAAWPRPEAWDNLMMALRLGQAPQCVATTTPRPKAWLKRIVEAADTVLTRGRSMENRYNLAPGFLAAMEQTYGGTRLGRQELDGEFLADIPGALWQRDRIEQARMVPADAPGFERIVVAIDPAASHHAASNETGIVVAARAGETGYVLEDLSGRRAPADWAAVALDAFHRHRADRIVAEINQGGDMVEQVLRSIDPSAPLRLVRASRGKQLRAEPVAALYEQGRVRHLGRFDALEDQMCGFTGARESGSSPDRLDALVWALSELLLNRNRTRTEQFLI